MITFYPHYLEALKNCVLTASGIKNLTPSDCKLISSLVTTKTRQTVSETTLKRVFGFAYSKFKPSYFTIDVLAKYCDYEGWESFCKAQNNLKPKAASNTDFNNYSLQENAAKITAFTLQALKNKSGIPYNQTIKREFIDDHLNEFINSEYTGTIISAPAGYGKTIAICHWIDEKLAAQSQTSNNDVVLFFSSDALMSTLISGMDINNWMLALLGYNTDNDISAIIEETQSKNSKFYLIIDGLNGHMLKNDNFNLIFKQLMDIFALYQQYKWFKLILVTRASTWINYRHEMEFGENTWFTGFNNQNGFINVPLFSPQELKQLSHKINPLATSDIPIQIAETFNHPLFFQTYYKNHKDSFYLNEISQIDIYEAIACYAYNKIYLGPYSSEKLLFIAGLIAEFDIKNGIYRANKLKLNDLVKQYNHAYNELLSIGFLRELNESNSYKYNTNIMFTNTNLMEHSLATSFIYKNNNHFDEKFVRLINETFINSPHKINTLKWGIIHAIKNQELDSIECLADANLNANEKSELLLFLSEALEREYSTTKSNDFLNYHISEKLFEYFLGWELMSTDYKKFLNVLLKFKLTYKQQILIHTTLAMIALLQLNMQDTEVQLSALVSYPKAAYEKFVINPLNCIEAIYYHLKYGILKKEVLVDLTKLMFNINEYLPGFKQNAVNDSLYLLGLITLQLCNNPKKTLRYIKLLKNNYRKELMENDPSSYNFIIRSFVANAQFTLGNTDKTTEIYSAMCSTYKKEDNMLTSYMKILFHHLKIKTYINSTKEDLIFNEIRTIDTIKRSEEYKFNRLYMYFLLLRTNNIEATAPTLYKQISYELNRIIKGSGLNMNSCIGKSIINSALILISYGAIML